MDIFSSESKALVEAVRVWNAAHLSWVAVLRDWVAAALASSGAIPLATEEAPLSSEDEVRA